MTGETKILKKKFGVGWRFFEYKKRDENDQWIWICHFFRSFPPSVSSNPLITFFANEVIIMTAIVIIWWLIVECVDEKWWTTSLISSLFGLRKKMFLENQSIKMIFEKVTIHASKYLLSCRENKKININIFVAGVTSGSKNCNNNSFQKGDKYFLIIANVWFF